MTQLRLCIVRRSGLILLESAPNGLDPADVKHDLEKARTNASGATSREAILVTRLRMMNFNADQCA